MAVNRRYYSGIDVLKLLAAVAVVYLHAVGQTDLAETSLPTRFAVPFFAASAAYLAFRSAIARADAEVTRYIRSRFSRIYLPFLIWTLIYLLVRAAWSIGRQGPLPEFGFELLWKGSAHHLWFLPFVLVVTIFAFAVARSFRGQKMLVTGAAVLVLSGVAYYLLIARLDQPLNYTVELSGRNAPVVLWTLAILCLAEAGIGTWFPVRLVRCLAPPAFLIALMMLALIGRNMLLENISGLVALGAALSLNIHDRDLSLKTLAGYAYGIYLCHILFVEGAQDVARLAGLGRGALVTVCVFILALLCSLGLCRLLALLPCAEAFGVPMLRAKRQPHIEVAGLGSDSRG